MHEHSRCAVRPKYDALYGKMEAVYQEAMEIELKSRGIPFEAQKPLVVFYKGNALKKRYEADIFCFDLIIVELKALDKLSTNGEAQLLNDLNATKVRLGLLISFGSRGRLEWKRFIH